VLHQCLASIDLCGDEKSTNTSNWDQTVHDSWFICDIVSSISESCKYEKPLYQSVLLLCILNFNRILGHVSFPCQSRNHLGVHGIINCMVLIIPKQEKYQRQTKIRQDIFMLIREHIFMLIRQYTCLSRIKLIMFTAAIGLAESIMRNVKPLSSVLKLGVASTVIWVLSLIPPSHYQDMDHFKIIIKRFFVLSCLVLSLILFRICLVFMLNDRYFESVMALRLIDPISRSAKPPPFHDRLREHYVGHDDLDKHFKSSASLSTAIVPTSMKMKRKDRHVGVLSTLIRAFHFQMIQLMSGHIPLVCLFPCLSVLFCLSVFSVSLSV
jgi:hypothetical protein